MEDQTTLPEVRPTPQHADSRVPPEVICHVVRFVTNVRDFFIMRLLSKEIQRYIDTEDPKCASHLLFTVRGPNSRRRSGNSLLSGPSPILSTGVFGRKKQKAPPNVPAHLLLELDQIYPEVKQPSVYSMPFDALREFLPKNPTTTTTTTSTTGGRDSSNSSTGGPLLSSSKKTYVTRLRSRQRIDSTESTAGSFFRELKNLLHHFPNIQHVELHNVTNCSADHFAQSNLNFPLRTLVLQQCGISDADFAGSSILSTELRELRLRACGENGALTGSLLQHLPKLEKLEVECIVNRFDWAGPPKHATLRKLTLSNVNVNGSLPEGSFRNLAVLDALVLSRVNAINDNSFTQLPRTVTKLVVYLCEGQYSPVGIRAAIGDEGHAAGMDEFSITAKPEEMFRLGGSMMAPSASQISAYERACEQRKEKLGGMFQLKNLV